MKILHICLANFYIDNFSYQENMLTKYHKKIGNEVEILASLVTFDSNGKRTLLNKPISYYNEDSIPVTRLAYKTGMKKLRRYNGTYQCIQKSKPDIIFIHGCQFLDIDQVVKYLKDHQNVKVYVDNHADFSNSARTWLSKNILHKIIWRHCAKIIEPYTSKFYGVLPARVEFLKNIYNLPEEKIELLVMGADDEKVKEALSNRSKEEIRKRLNIQEDDFLIMTGGKINNSKIQTFELIKAVRNIKSKNVKLVIFGSLIEELKDKMDDLLDDDRINYIGWINSDDSYKYFAASDLAVFPGRHSVFWEQVVGLGVPLLVKHWNGTTHINTGGNCQFLYEDSEEEIREKLVDIISNKEVYNHMRNIAKGKSKNKFSYKEIALNSIEQN